MFDALQKYWNQHGFDILVLFSIIFIIFYAFFRLGKKGTYMKTLSLSSTKDNFTNITKKKPQDSQGEIICRQYLEKRFGKSFSKKRPDFLSNPVTGGHRNLELDCFNEDLKLALEYNGVQHYKFVPFFHTNKETFYNQKYRDEIKRMKCKEKGIILIEVPYTIPHQDLEKYVEEQLQKYNF
jgi:hypothetical protein